MVQKIPFIHILFTAGQRAVEPDLTGRYFIWHNGIRECKTPACGWGQMAGRAMPGATGAKLCFGSKNFDGLAKFQLISSRRSLDMSSGRGASKAIG